MTSGLGHGEGQSPEAIASCNGDLRIIFSDKNQGRKSAVTVNGTEIFLQPKMIAYLRIFYHAYLDKKPWVNRDKFEPGFNQAKYISKLRRELDATRIGIEYNGNGAYRLAKK